MIRVVEDRGRRYVVVGGSSTAQQACREAEAVLGRDAAKCEPLALREYVRARLFSFGRLNEETAKAAWQGFAQCCQAIDVEQARLRADERRAARERMRRLRDGVTA